jgi:DNA (cytosine-5)-methyltransferase 1
VGNQLLVRNVPQDVRNWIERERETRRMSQQEFVISLLKQASADSQTLSLPFAEATQQQILPEPGGMPFRFIDLFAGIGGFRLGLEQNGGKCVFTSEWDKYSQKTYKAWYGDTPHGDIREIEPSAIPDHDVLAAGFPCQPFSIAGVSKKNSLGRAHGFECVTQGTLFFNVAAIADIKRPPVLLLENVKNLKSHDKGKTWQVIRETLESLHYTVFHKIIDAAGWVPQHRERIYIVCFDRHVFGDNPPFAFPEPPAAAPKLRDILDENPEPRYTLTDHLWKYLQNYAQRHREKGNGFGFGLADPDGVTRTLSARYYKDGSEILIRQPRKNPRRLTPSECARLMGFPDGLSLVVSDTQAYRQFGNAVVPKVAAAVMRQIQLVFEWQLARTGNGCLIKGRDAAKAKSNGHK